MEMPKRLGLDMILAGVGMGKLKQDEEELRTLPRSLEFAGKAIALHNDLYYSQYVNNHSLLSLYHPDFALSLSSVFASRHRKAKTQH